MLIATTQASDTAYPKKANMTAGYTIIGNGRTNILRIFVSFGTPDHRAKSCQKVFLGTCSLWWPGSSVVLPLVVVFSALADVLSSSDGDDGSEVELLLVEAMPVDRYERSYRVSGQKKSTTSQLTAVKMKAIHLCQRQPRLCTTNPHISGPTVLPPEMEFMYIPIRLPRS